MGIASAEMSVSVEDPPKANTAQNTSKRMKYNLRFSIMVVVASAILAYVALADCGYPTDAPNPLYSSGTYLGSRSGFEVVPACFKIVYDPGSSYCTGEPVNCWNKMVPNTFTRYTCITPPLDDCSKCTDWFAGWSNVAPGNDAESDDQPCNCG